MVLQTLLSPDRESFEIITPQRTDGYLSLKSLMLIGNKQRINDGLLPITPDKYFSLPTNKGFIDELESQIGKKAYIAGRGRGADSWLHPFLFIDIALWLSPKLKVEVYKWVFDNLVKNRISSCDSYKKMCGVLFEYSNRKDKFQANIKSLANKIKSIIAVDDWNKCTALQLQRRDELQNLISDLTNTLQNANKGVELAFDVYKKKYLQNERMINE